MQQVTLMHEFISHPWINPDTVEAREYQENVVKTALTGNTLCVLPTGLGKTNIAARGGQVASTFSFPSRVIGLPSQGLAESETKIASV